jgi:hypothetical protein
MRCAYFRRFFSPAFSPFRVANPSLARSLFVSSTCASQISLRGVRRERRSPGKFSETKNKIKFRYERIVVKCLLLANLGNWTHAVLDLLWCHSWQFVVGISSHFFAVANFLAISRRHCWNDL